MVLLAAAVVGAALYLVAGRLLGIEAVIALLDRVRGAPHTSMSQP